MSLIKKKNTNKKITKQTALKQKLAELKRQVTRRALKFGEYDSAKTESATAWLSRSKAGICLLNLSANSVLGTVAVLKKLQAANARFKGESASSIAPSEPLLYTVTAKPRILLIVEPSIPQCFRYRVQQKIELLEALGHAVEWFAWSECREQQQRIHYSDIVIFYRVPALPAVLNAINYAKQLGKLTVYDIDDLVFDQPIMTAKLAHETTLSAQQKTELLHGAELYQKAISACDYGIASTASLQAYLEKQVAKRKAYLLPNGLDKALLQAVEQPFAEKINGRITIFYGSGTSTHDADFALVAEPIATLMQSTPKLHLMIVGHLNLPVELSVFSKRVHQLPIMDSSTYMQCLRHADIAIAPLINDAFADCKSAIKWLEAAAVNVPCIVSNTAEYQQILHDGKDVLIASSKDEWLNHLSALINQPQLSEKIAKAAKTLANKKFGIAPQQKTLQILLTDLQSQAVNDKCLLPMNAKAKRLLMVNTQYPPNAIGGATKVVKNLVDSMVKNHPEVEVSVLTAEVVNTDAYSLREYRFDNVNVTVLRVPYRHSLESQAEDPKIVALCIEWLAQSRPDIIHFHSMQHLTASPLVAAKQLAIPYFVTVHDAWWISEHQFMLDAQNQRVDALQLHPLIAAKTATNVPATLARSQRLASLLSDAEKVLAVSKYQANFYQRNGFRNVVLNVNGVDAPVNATPRRNVDKGKLKLAYIGGQSAHKGYDLLKQVFQENYYPNLELQTVDLFKAEQYRADAKWGENKVRVIGKQLMSEISKFYANIDVLIAPSIWPESFGLVTREAALHGLWVVAAEAGGLAEDVNEGENGFTFAMGDKQKLANILSNLNQGYCHYRDNKPNSVDVRDQIVSVEKQTQELITLINSACKLKIPNCL